MSSVALALPPTLHEGDRLTSREFLRLWDAMPDLKYAELLDGTVFTPPPVIKPHSETHSEMNAWLWLYKDATPGGQSDDSGRFPAGAPNS